MTPIEPASDADVAVVLSEQAGQYAVLTRTQLLALIARIDVEKARADAAEDARFALLGDATMHETTGMLAQDEVRRLADRITGLKADVLRLTRELTDEKARSESLVKQLLEAEKLEERTMVALKRRLDAQAPSDAADDLIAGLRAKDPQRAVERLQAENADLQAALRWRSRDTVPDDQVVEVMTAAGHLLLAHHDDGVWAADGECCPVAWENECDDDPVIAWRLHTPPQRSGISGDLPADAQPEAGEVNP